MTNRVVLLTAQADIRTAVARVAALAGVDLETVSASHGLRPAWRQATSVVVGADLAELVAHADLPRRGSVSVVTVGAADEGLWRSTVTLGASGLFTLPDHDRQLIDLLAETGEPRLLGSVIGVLGGCGGAGASTFATALALISSRSDLTLLVDGDPLGGGLDVLIGAERSGGTRWSDLAETRGRLAADVLADHVLRVGRCALLSWGRQAPCRISADAAASVTDAAVRAFRRVVIDLPRSRDDAGEVLLAACDAVVVVLPATVRAVMAAMATVEAAGCHSIAQAVVRDPASGRLTPRDIERATGLRVVTSFRSERSVAAAADRGDPPIRGRRGSLATACHEVITASVTDSTAA
jgi:secretion/DNA translocation related CpaE-like protein